LFFCLALALALALTLTLALAWPGWVGSANAATVGTTVATATQPANMVAADDFGFAEPYFSTVGDAESIPSGIVTALLKDAKGWLWIGTQNGLIRFDGYHFRRFVHDDANPASIGSNFVSALWQGPDGRLWIGTFSEGVSVFDPASEKFSHFRPRGGQADGVAGGRVWALAGDGAGGVWIGSDEGLDHVAPAGAALQHFRHDKNKPDSLADNRVYSLLLDKQGTLWVGSGNGLQRRTGQPGPGSSTAPGSFEAIASDPAQADSLAGQEVRVLFQASDESLWIGTREQGAAWLSKAALSATAGHSSLQRLPPDAGRADHISHGWVTAIAQPQAGRIWLGTSGGGINIVAAQDGKVVQRMQHEAGKPGSLVFDTIGAMLLEPSGLLWVGTWGGGLQHHNTRNQFLRLLRHGHNALSSPDVRSVLERADGRILVGSKNNGIDIIDRKLGLVGGYRPQQADGLKDGAIFALAQTADGAIWAGTQQSGVARLASGDTRWQSFGSAQGLPLGTVKQFMVARDGTLWVATESGVARFLSGPQRFEAATRIDGSAMQARVAAIAEDAQGRMWFASNNGLWLKMPGTAGLQVIRRDESRADSLASNDVRGLLTDRSGQLWVTTGKGLARLQSLEGQRAGFEHVSALAGQPGRFLGSNPLQDGQGRIWVEAFMYDPVTRKMLELTKADGFDVGTNWIGSYAATRDGLLLHGGSQGLIVIDPARFRPWSYQPPLMVTELKIDGQQVIPDTRPDTLPASLTLLPGQRSFSLEFSALDFSAPKANRYAYRLQGYDKDWIATDSEHRSANYGNLRPGQYVLQVRGSNRSGEWSAQQLAIAVKVLPAFWQASWFLALALLALCASLWGAWRWHLARLQARSQALQALIEQRTAEALAAHAEARAAHDEAQAAHDEAQAAHDEALAAQQQLTLERQLEEARQQMLQQEKMAALGTLTAGVAHEINNPTNFTHVAAQIQRINLDKFESFLTALMSDDPDPALIAEFGKHFEELRANIGIMLEGTGRIQTIIKDLRAFSRRDQAEKKSLHLSECLRSTLNLVRINWNEQVEFITEIIDDPLYECWPPLLNQVFLNLMVNGCHAIAMKQRSQATPVRGHLWLRLRVQTEEKADAQTEGKTRTLVVEVEDDGCGIEPHVRERILEPFFTTKDLDSGTGLGLSITNGIIGQHNGSLTIASTPGAGSCFAIHLPLDT
jgi:signal transduction histidine kinase/ligand-binding sensor domain-containing protein